jgi:hypothetical protein
MGERSKKKNTPGSAFPGPGCDSLKFSVTENWLVLMVLLLTNEYTVGTTWTWRISFTVLSNDGSSGAFHEGRDTVLSCILGKITKAGVDNALAMM